MKECSFYRYITSVEHIDGTWEHILMDGAKYKSNSNEIIVASDDELAALFLKEMLTDRALIIPIVQTTELKEQKERLNYEL